MPLLFHCDKHVSMAPHEIDRATFVRMVAEDLHVHDAQAESYVRGVFQTLAQTVSAGEIEDVLNNLPEDLRALWPARQEH